MPRSSSGTRNVARSLATQISAIMAISSPPAWQIPLTAAMTGARLSRIAVNGRMSYPMSGDLVAGFRATAEVAPGGEDVSRTGDDQRRQRRDRC